MAVKRCQLLLASYKQITLICQALIDRAVTLLPRLKAGMCSEHKIAEF